MKKREVNREKGWREDERRKKREVLKMYLVSLCRWTGDERRKKREISRMYLVSLFPHYMRKGDRLLCLYYHFHSQRARKSLGERSGREKRRREWESVLERIRQEKRR